MLKSKAPILVSSGMSNWDELDNISEKLRSAEHPFAIFQCTSEYPTVLQRVGLNVIKEMHQRFKVPIGLSDHSGTIYPGLAAMALGASLLEVHVVFSKEMFGPDTSSSVTIRDLRELVKAKDAYYLMFSHPVNKNKSAERLTTTKTIFNKSVALKNNQKSGTVLTIDMLTVKKPGTGISAADLQKCVGCRLASDVSNNSLLRWEDLEKPNEKK